MIRTLGFTGTRHKLTKIQAAELYKEIMNFKIDCKINLKCNYSSVDGMCVGADEIFNTICTQEGFKTEGRPGPKTRFSTIKRVRHKTYEAVAFLQRNKDIVDNSDLIIACPSTEKEQLRSGTWSTIRYAKSIEKPIIIILPSGNIEKYN